MGFTSPIIFSLLVTESLLIGFAGGLLGCGGAYIVLKVFAINAGTASPFSMISMPAPGASRRAGGIGAAGNRERAGAGYLGGAAQYRRCAPAGGLRWPSCSNADAPHGTQN